MLNRRTLLSSATAGVVAAKAPKPLRAATPKFDAVVIGSGLSGLYAAMLLEEQGLSVQVLKAETGWAVAFTHSWAFQAVLKRREN